MKYIPCNSALLAQKTLFLTQKGTVFQIYKSFGIWEDPPPHVGKNSQIISFFFLRAYPIMLKCCPPLYSAADSRAPHSKCRQRLQYAERQNKFLSILLENASHALRKLLKVISAVKIRSVWQSVHNLSCYQSCDDFILCSIPTSFPLNYLHNVLVTFFAQ